MMARNTSAPTSIMDNRTRIANAVKAMRPRSGAFMTTIVSVSVKGAREGASAKELDRLGALLGKIGERHHQVLIELLASGVPWPGVDRHVADFKVLAQRKASEHRRRRKRSARCLSRTASARWRRSSRRRVTEGFM